MLCLCMLMHACIRALSDYTQKNDEENELKLFEKQQQEEEKTRRRYKKRKNA